MSECMICLEELKNSIAELKCGHKFHFNCITSWMKNKNNYVNFCPLCPINNEIINVIHNPNEINQDDTLQLPIIENHNKNNDYQNISITNNIRLVQNNPNKKCTIL